MTDQTATVAAKRQQVTDQYRAVAHLARAIADLHLDLLPLAEGSAADRVLDTRGRQSAELLNDLGDILNDMDAVDPEDKWVNPILERANEMFVEGAKTVKPVREYRVEYRINDRGRTSRGLAAPATTDPETIADYRAMVADSTADIGLTLQRRDIAEWEDVEP